MFPVRDARKSKAELLDELRSLRARVAGLEADSAAAGAGGPFVADGDHLIRKAFDGATDGVFVIDTDCKVLHANRAMLDLVGLDAERVLGSRCYDTVGKSACSRNSCAVNEIFGGKDRIGPLVVWDVCSRGGYCLLSAWAVRDDAGQVDAAVVELRADDKSIRMILASMNHFAMAVYDLDGEVLASWTGEEKRYGLSSDEALGMNIRDIYPAELADARIARIREAAVAPGPLCDVYHAPLPGGTYWLETTLSPIRDAAGNVSAVMGLIRDITEQKEAEKALENKNIALQELLEAVEEQKHRIERQVQASVDRIVMPLLNDLSQGLAPGQEKQLEAVRTALREIASPFAERLSRQVEVLSPAEVRICEYIHSGMSTKDIAHSLHISPATVNKHREHIRRKFGLVGKDVNLTTHLAGLATDELQR